MEGINFEHLLAMMRLLRHEDDVGSRLGMAIVDILNIFDEKLDSRQRKELNREFVSFAQMMQKKRMQTKFEKEMEKEDYRDMVSDYLWKEEVLDNF